MRVLTNQRVKIMFLQMILCILAFSAVTGWVSVLAPGKGIWLYPMMLLGMGAAMLAVCYRYFREQDRILRDAVVKIRAYLAGERDVRIVCNEEGE